MTKNHNENEHQSSHFLLGALIGAAATALLTTKTGRKILTEISENGTDLLEEKITPEQHTQGSEEIEEVPDQAIEEQAKKITKTTVVSPKPDTQKAENKENAAQSSSTKEKNKTAATPKTTHHKTSSSQKPKRLFKGIK